MSQLRQRSRQAAPDLPILRRCGDFQLKKIIIMLLLYPLSVYALDKKTQTLLDSGKYEQAYEYILGSSTVAADSEESLYLLGITAQSGKNLSPYLKEYMQHYPNGPHIEQVRHHLADYYSAQGLNITASRLYPESPMISDYQNDELYRLAFYRQQIGEYSSAIDLYGSLLADSDTSIAEWARLGISDCALAEGRVDIAIEGYKAIIDEDLDIPSMPFAYLGLASAYSRANKPDKAQKLYQQYREKFPSAAPSLELETAMTVQDQDVGQASAKTSKAIKADYYIQVGVFSKKDNSKACLRKFRTLGYQARMNEFDENGQRFYRVLIGPYADEQSSRHAKAELEKTQSEQFIIFVE
jgi:tetratricopeptide (TPR) repeat protein